MVLKILTLMQIKVVVPGADSTDTNTNICHCPWCWNYWHLRKYKSLSILLKLQALIQIWVAVRGAETTSSIKGNRERNPCIRWWDWERDHACAATDNICKSDQIIAESSWRDTGVKTTRLLKSAWSKSWRKPAFFLTIYQTNTELIPNSRSHFMGVKSLWDCTF